MMTCRVLVSTATASFGAQYGIAADPSAPGHPAALNCTKTTSLAAAQWPSVIHTPGPPHSESDAHARQVFADVLHTGVVPEQSVFARHPTQEFVAVLHAGVGVLQSVEATH
jgi:hypothetical protein